MILNPWIIGIYVNLSAMLVLHLYALRISLAVVRRWDVRSMEEGQLALERKSFLASTIIHYGLWLQLLSLILFYMALESVSEVIPGAMCAAGAIKANVFGFPALFVRMAIPLICAVWFAVHRLDSRLEDYGLTPLKFKLLFLLAPFLFADLVLQFLYFSNLDPNVVTSCCGVVFEMEGEGFGASLASLPPYPTMLLFYVFIVLLLLAGYRLLRGMAVRLLYLYSCLGVVLFIISILSMVSFISPYIYEAPTLHCPFCILRREYGHIGFLLYFFLFGAFFYSLIPGLIQLLKGKSREIEIGAGGLQKRALQVSLTLWIFFAFIPSLIIVLYEIRTKGGHLFA